MNKLLQEWGEKISKKDRKYLSMLRTGCKLHSAAELSTVENSLLDHLEHYILFKYT